MRESFACEMQAECVSSIKDTIMAPFGLLTSILALLEDSLHGLFTSQRVRLHIPSVHTKKKNTYSIVPAPAVLPCFVPALKKLPRCTPWSEILSYHGRKEICWQCGLLLKIQGDAKLQMVTPRATSSSAC